MKRKANAARFVELGVATLARGRAKPPRSDERGYFQKLTFTLLLLSGMGSLTSGIGSR